MLEGGHFGTLELKAPACEAGTDPAQRTQECERSFCPCVSDGRVFEIVSELLAEGWAMPSASSKMEMTLPSGLIPRARAETPYAKEARESLCSRTGSYGRPQARYFPFKHTPISPFPG